VIMDKRKIGKVEYSHPAFINTVLQLVMNLGFLIYFMYRYYSQDIGPPFGF
jgi:hypothetical protein